MEVKETAIPGALIIEPKVLGDSRGFFTELYHSERYAKNGIPSRFVQDNFSRSAQRVLRGLHIQNPNSQGKLVTVIRGAVLDVAVDVRVGSPTYATHVKVKLDDDNRRQFWIPGGLAHGFIVLSESADVLYKCDAHYRPADELVVRWNDPELAIDWGCPDPLLSARDQRGRSVAELKSLLPRFEKR